MQGCLPAIIILAMLGMLGSCMGGEDDYEDDYESNPYTEDFDGDGLNGDADDHEILHQMPTCEDC